jgi:hypothetical protein
MVSDGVNTLSGDDDLPSSSALGRLHLMTDSSDTSDVPLIELPRERALELLTALCSSYGRRILRASELLTESQRHAIAHGHPLRFGCCASGDLLTSGEGKDDRG